MNTDVIFTQCDCFSIPIRISTVKKLVLTEMQRLALDTGCPIDKLFIRFFTRESSCLACFRYTLDIFGQYDPLGFEFFTPLLQHLSARQLIDVTRHEFAHYVRLMRHGPTSDENCHDALWQKICLELGCTPSPYHTPHVTQLFSSSHS